MTRFLGYIAMSLDARIADAAGGIGWLQDFEGGAAGDYGYRDFYAGVDAVVLGRGTYDAIADWDWPYPGKSAYVVTSRPLEVGGADAVAVPPDYTALKGRLRADGRACVWIVGGGQTQRGALDAGMFDELRLFVMPLVLGGGPLVFADGAPHRANLSGHRVWPGGVVQLNYEF